MSVLQHDRVIIMLRFYIIGIYFIKAFKHLCKSLAYASENGVFSAPYRLLVLTTTCHNLLSSYPALLQREERGKEEKEYKRKAFSSFLQTTKQVS